MSTLTQTYCTFCAVVSKGFDNLINLFERIGRARAASELARQGYYKEAKSLMLEKNIEDTK